MFIFLATKTMQCKFTRGSADLVMSLVSMLQVACEEMNVCIKEGLLLAWFVIPFPVLASATEGWHW